MHYLQEAHESVGQVARMRSPRRDDVPDMTQLAELLLREAASADEPRDVLLDLERNGVRCVVVRSKNASPPAQPAAEEMLSPREREIARMVADGLPNKTIAAVLDISAWTVNAHLRRAFTKLGVTSRAAMVAKLLKGRG
jgi:DNA-binding CsgD family transcriptional regulator